MQSHPEAPDERFVHRLEAFSDIVIGFSLAQLGATLVVPSHASSLISNPQWLFAFAWTFALVCLMWWSHNRIFRTSSVTSSLGVILNFVLLATIVLLVYFAQAFARSTDLHDIIIAARLYFGMLAVNNLITAWMYVIAHGTRRAVTVNAVSGAVQLIVLLALVPLGDNPYVLPVMGCTVPIAFTLGAIAGRRLGRVSSAA